MFRRSDLEKKKQQWKKAYEAVNETMKRKQEKELITQQFHRSLKSLQQKEHVDGATIVSNECSNTMCSVLEAVFLHGIKDNMMAKLVSYAHGSGSEVKLNFWSVVKKFTHKDVLVQLKELSQINSDIGLCRAWVRLAITDGLMASYLASMKADSKAMTYFYHPWAYLLDFEQPDILYNHLTGLMGLNFHLSLNSSVLNTWSSVTTALAGLAPEGPSLQPVVRSATPTPPHSRTNSQSSLNAAADNDTTNTANTIAANTTANTTWSTTSDAIPAHCSEVVMMSTPPNTPADPNFFTHAQDTDILKRFGAGLMSSSVSSGSSGQASCPDPGESLSARSSRSASPFGSPYDSLRYMSRQDRKLDEEMKLKALLMHWDQKELEREEREEKEKKQREQREKEEQERQRKAEEREKRKQAQREKREREERERRRITEEKSADLAEAKKLSSSSSAENNKVCGGGGDDGRSGGDDSLRGERVSSASSSKCQEDGAEGLTSHTDSLQDSIEEALSENVGGSQIRSSSDHVSSNPPSSSPYSYPSSYYPSSPSSSPSAYVPAAAAAQKERVKAGESGEEKEVEEEGWKEREEQSSLGNSLNAMDGWTSTSPYYPPNHYHHQQQQQQDDIRRNRQHSTVDMSYESMLQGYRDGQGDDSGIVPVDKVIGNLPNNNSNTTITTTTNTTNTTAANTTISSSSSSNTSSANTTGKQTGGSKDEAFTAVDMTVKLEQMKALCRWTGNQAQNNKCATPSCNMGIGFFHGPGVICSFDGKTYCEQCHLSQFAYIPAEIVFNWNFRKQKVCVENFKFLQKVQEQALLDLEELSPGIYSTVPQLYAVMQLRIQLTSLRSYMFMCSESTAAQLKDRVWPREHLYLKVHLYSVNDLLDVRSGKLEAFLREVVELGQRHVHQCTLCQAKGFYCELCQDPTPIFPFQVNATVKCKNCKNVYHSRCKTDTVACPKCVRYAQRGVHKQHYDDDDYACSPDL